MRLLCALFLCLPAAAAPSLRWIDVKGDVHVEELRGVVEESPSGVVVDLADGVRRVVPAARILDLVREGDAPDEQALLAARRDVEFGVRLDEARATLDRLVGAEGPSWVREYAAAARAILAERAREEDAEKRLDRFLAAHPQSRFQSEAVLSLALVRARAAGRELPKAMEELRAAHDRIEGIDGPLALRFRTLRHTTELVVAVRWYEFDLFFHGMHDSYSRRVLEGADYGAFLLLEAEVKRSKLALYRATAAVEMAAGRPPRGPLADVRRLREGARIDLPEARSDIELDLARLLEACGEREEARAALGRARDLAPDPNRREAAEEALRGLDGKPPGGAPRAEPGK